MGLFLWIKLNFFRRILQRLEDERLTKKKEDAVSGKRIIQSLHFILSAFPVFGSATATCGESASSNSAIQTRIEILNRIDPELYRQSTKVRQLVDDSLGALNGQPGFIDLTIRFGVTNQTAALLSISSKFPRHPSSAQAIVYLLNIGEDRAVENYFKKNFDASLLEQLVRTSSTKAMDAAIPFLFDRNLESSAAKELLSALCWQKEGAKRVLKALKSSSSEDVSKLARQALVILKQTPWSQIRKGFEELVPSSAIVRSEELPERSELVKRTGNVEQGRIAFRQSRNTCVSCHRVEGFGKNVGPDLSEIGKKLGKDALYEAILDPSAGISVGYEGWEITLESGEEFSGILLGEQDGQITMRNLLGESVVILQEDVSEKRQMRVSIMPSGLDQVISQTDLVNLVEYLSQLGR